MAVDSHGWGGGAWLPSVLRWIPPSFEAVLPGKATSERSVWVCKPDAFVLAEGCYRMDGAILGVSEGMELLSHVLPQTDRGQSPGQHRRG